MHLRILLLFAILTFSYQLYGQNADSVRYMDGLIAKRNTEKLTGRIPTYYSSGFHQRAVTLQKAFQGASAYYEQLYHKTFHLKLAVLDSAQWLSERVPWGFLSYEHGWAAIPAQVSYSDLLHIYGITDKKARLDSLLWNNHISERQLLSSVYLVYALHELGHYFIVDLNQCDEPDMFANELIATYFSYNYFELIHSHDLQVLKIFSQFISKNYPASYRQIDAMDNLYMRMPIQNFKWFHCNIVLLSGQIHRHNSGEFIGWYLKTFAKDKTKKRSTAQIIALLDKKTNGIVGKWAANLSR